RGGEAQRPDPHLRELPRRRGHPLAGAAGGDRCRGEGDLGEVRPVRGGLPGTARRRAVPGHLRERGCGGEVVSGWAQVSPPRRRPGYQLSVISYPSILRGLPAAEKRSEPN